MSGSMQLDRIQEQMGRLKLVRTAAELALLLQDASKREISYADLLEEVFSRELAAKQERHAAMKMLTLTGIRRNLDHLVGSAGAEVPQVVRVGRV